MACSVERLLLRRVLGDSCSALSLWASSVACAALLTSGMALSQVEQNPPSQTQPATSQTQTAPEPAEGVNAEGYNIHQSIEFGGHISDFSGSEDIWNTFVNLHSGPRLLEQSLDMRAVEHAGILFDRLSFFNAGYGGDPNNMTRLRVAKNKWYNFSVNFRRDRNFWNYDLLANPLNPQTANPAFPTDVRVLNSPHNFGTVRRMTDYSLSLLPLSPLRFRLGYNRNVNEGPSFSSFHEGTDVPLFQPWRVTSNSFQFGVDYRPARATNISYDQFFQAYKGDTHWFDGNQTYVLTNGVPVDLGLPFDATPAVPASRTPCATPIVNQASTPPTAIDTCNGYIGYSRFGPSRVNTPTEQLTFQSSYFKRLDLAGRFGYSSGENELDNFVESFVGLVTRTRQRTFNITGPAKATRVSVNTDFGVTGHITERLRLVDSFRWADFRIPGQWNSFETSTFGTSMLINPNTFPSATCPPPFTGAGCPQHAAASGGDVIAETFTRFLGQDSKINTVSLEYDFSKRFTGHVGYRFRHRNITHRLEAEAVTIFFPILAARGACAAGNPDGFRPDPVTGICTASTTEDDEEDITEINEHSGLVGFWFRPLDELRVSVDTEFMSADNTLTRISPRQFQRYDVRTTYKPKDWMNLGFVVNILEKRNNVTDVNNLQHNRSYSFNATLLPNQTWGLDLSYSYLDVFSQSNICFVSTPAPAGTVKCALAPTFLESVSFYDSKTHFASAGLMFKPVKRVTTNVGYSGVFVNGTSLLLNPNAPLGPLQLNYHLPTAGLDVELAKNWTWRTYWNFYGYNEKSDPGPTAPRDTRGNVFTLALRYAF